MISKILHVSGMEAESEFTDVYLDLIRQHGIPTSTQSDNIKTEMSQHVWQIHGDLGITDQVTETHSP
jgi:hypothetical protein